MMCLAMDPDERPADADAMVEALIDCVQASMFHLPLADSATGAVISSSSLTGVPNPDALQSEVSNANLSRAASQGSSVATSLATGQPATQRGLRPTTHRGLRPPTNNRLRPPSVPARAASAHLAGPDPVSTIITLEAASVASPRGNWGLVIGATAALLAGGLLAAVYVLGGPGEQPPAPTVAGIAAAASASDRARASEVLDQVDADILSGEFDTARGKLDAASRELDANPERLLQ